MKVRSFLFGLVALLFVSCAAENYELPADYKGSTATLKNGINRNAGKTFVELYAPTEINGVKDSRTHYVPTGPYGTYTTNDNEISRKIPSGKNLVKIRVSKLHAMPILQIADSATGAKQSLEGDVYFEAKANGVYEVKGSLIKGQEAVWIQDASSGKLVGRKIQ